MIFIITNSQRSMMYHYRVFRHVGNKVVPLEYCSSPSMRQGFEANYSHLVQAMFVLLSLSIECELYYILPPLRVILSYLPRRCNVHLQTDNIVIHIPSLFVSQNYAVFYQHSRINCIFLKYIIKLKSGYMDPFSF